MAKLYLSAETDMIKTLRTARAKDWISVKLHFDEEHYDRTISIKLYRSEPDVFKAYQKLIEGRNVKQKREEDLERFRELTINGKKVCEIDKETGIMVCHIDGKYDFNTGKWIEGD